MTIYNNLGKSKKHKSISSQFPKISIIVPIYNTAMYLRKCIDSVLYQTFRNWELILVDDGSTDQSGKICDEYAEKDKRIRVKHKKNSGVSDTRNVGIDMTKGEWIFFLDSDDELFDYSLEKMIEWSRNVDMVFASFMNVTDQNRFVLKSHKGSTKHLDKTLSSKSLVKKLGEQEFFLKSTISPKLFKVTILSQSNIRFDPNIYYAEDQLFVAQYISSPNVKFIYVNNKLPVYQYNIRSGNATSKNNEFNYKLFTDFIGFMKIAEVYNMAFHNKKINKWTRQNAYNSGRHLLQLMNESNIATSEQKKFINEGLNKLTNDGSNKMLRKIYETRQSLMRMKRKAGPLTKEQRIILVNNWLHSIECTYTALNLKWKLSYIVSHIMGRLGVRLFIDKINF